MESNQNKSRRRRIIEPQAGPSSADPLPLFSPVKKQRSTVLSVGERSMIVNAFKYVQKTWPSDKYHSNTAMVANTAEILGVSKSSVYTVLKEYKQTHAVLPKVVTRKRSSIWEKLDSFTKSAIRRKVHIFFLEGKLPSLKLILQSINDDDMLPNFSKTTLHRILKKLQFKFMKRDRRSHLIDRPEIVLWRTKYLKEIEKFRNKNRRIFYLDETWVNAGYTVSKAWTDTTITSSHQAFVEGLSTGPKNPTGKGKRLIVVHIGNEEGFIAECRWVFECSKTSDYHESMDAKNFEEWFGKVLDKLQRNDVIVMDNASYHSRRKEKTPTTAWKKQDILNWLLSKNIAEETGDTKAQLLEKAKAIKSQFQSYVVDEMAKAKGIEVLRLPPYHCELNPIELVWADVKGHVARNNTTFKLEDVKNLLNDGLAKVTPEKWKNCVNHIKKEEIRMRNMDNILDTTVDSLIINVTDEDSTEDEYESTGSEISDCDNV